MAGPQASEARLSLEIRTKSVEQTLIPLVTQVGFKLLLLKIWPFDQRRHDWWRPAPFCSQSRCRLRPVSRWSNTYFLVIYFVCRIWNKTELIVITHLNLQTWLISITTRSADVLWSFDFLVEYNFCHSLVPLWCRVYLTAEGMEYIVFTHHLSIHTIQYLLSLYIGLLYVFWQQSILQLDLTMAWWQISFLNVIINHILNNAFGKFLKVTIRDDVSLHCSCNLIWTKTTWFNWIEYITEVFMWWLWIINDF